LIAVKDNICTSALPTTCASRILKGYYSPYNARVVQQLEDAGAIIAGKTNLDEFGMGSHSTNSLFGPIYQNASNSQEELSVGGSSGGSALAVATGQCWAALGTDTGGSVRLPAAYTGVVGFKPSYGLISRHGVIAYANSLDTVGILAPSSIVAQTVFEAVRGYDRQDPTSISPNTLERIKKKQKVHTEKKSFQIGVPIEYNIAELSPIVRSTWLEALEILASMGHSIHQVSLPTTKQALSAYYVIAPAEASSNLAKYDGVRYGNQSSQTAAPGNVLYATTRGEGFGHEVQKRILLGSYTLSASAIDNYFIKAQKVRRLVQQDFDRVFEMSNPLLDHLDHTAEVNGVDFLLTPIAPTTPPTLASLTGRSSIESYKDDVFTVPASLAGLPAMSVPFRAIGDTDNSDAGTSIGLQIIAQYGDDARVFKLAEVLESIARNSHGAP
jgi:aspartyl-tRNA(Asn)/glutamyl-tRNA(Gln) amidotransferase subunit A